MKNLEKKIISIQEYQKKNIRNKKTVFTNGCFDILHLGHVKLLNEAKKLGEILIIGLNSDESIKKLKGKKRPIMNQKTRSYILSSMYFVDFIIEFFGMIMNL